MNAQDILNTLKRGAHTVTFQKADGSIRSLVGYAPQELVLRTAGIVPIVEWGTGAFKSFKVDSLISIEACDPA